MLRCEEGIVAQRASCWGDSMGIYVFPLALLALFVWCVFQALCEARARWRLEDRIGEIGVDQMCGVTEQLVYPQIVRERR